MGLPAGFRGWPIQWNHAIAKCCGPTLVAMATKFGLGAEIQSPTGLFVCSFVRPFIRSYLYLSSAVQAKAKSCSLSTYCQPSSPPLWTREELGRAQSEVFHATTEATSSSFSGGQLSLSRTLDQDDGALKFQFVAVDNLTGGECRSSTSSTLFQIPECFSEKRVTDADREQNSMVPINVDGPRPATQPPPSDVLAANSSTGEVREKPLKRLARTVSVGVSAVQPRSPTPQTTDNVEEASDDEDEGECLITSISSVIQML